MSESSGAMWYVAHTYSGYENKVKDNIEATVQSRNMEDVILEVVVPLQEVEETKNGVRKSVAKKIFPGYVLVHMFMTDESWYVVRNTRGVTGFVGPASKPVALSEEELANMGIAAQAPKKPSPAETFRVGERIEVIEGPFTSNEGAIEDVNNEKRRLKINIAIFGRETPVELDFSQVKKI